MFSFGFPLTYSYLCGCNINQYIKNMERELKPVVNSTQLIAACGLYCGACRKYRLGKCPGCRMAECTDSEQPKYKWLQKCLIRKCCQHLDYSTCAECEKDVRECKTYNPIISKVFTYLFNSDRPACIRYLRRYGEEAYATQMSHDEKMTMKRK